MRLHGANFLTLRPGGGPVLRPYGANFLTPRQGGGPVLRLYGANILTPRLGGGPVLRLYGAKFLAPRPGGGPVLRPYGANFLTPADLNLTPRSRWIGCVVSAASIFSGFSGFRFFRFCSSGSVSPVRFCFIVRFGSPGSVHAGTAAGSISRGPVRFWESPVRLEVSWIEFGTSTPIEFGILSMIFLSKP